MKYRNMADQLKLGVYFFLTFMTLVCHVHLLVPPKTPVLSGFEPAAIGSYRELVCDAEQPGAGTITYKWFKYSKDTRTDAEDWESKGPIGTSRKYIFNPLMEKHVFPPGRQPEFVRGKYKCRASNSAGTRDSEWGDLLVYKPCSRYTVSVSPSKPAVGSTFTLNCYIPNPSGFTVTWTKRSAASSGANEVARANSLGCRPPPISRYSWSSCSKPSSTSRTFNLQVTNAQTSDSGGYWTCADTGLACSSKPIVLVIQAPPGKPQITGFPSGPVLVGTQLNLKCVASPPGDTYDWYKDNTKLTLTTSLTTFDFLVKKESAGVYKCVARNGAGSATSSDKILTVYFNPTKVTMIKIPHKPVIEKNPFQIVCGTDSANPVPDIKFYRKRVGGNLVELTSGISSTTVDAQYNGKIRRSTLTVKANREDNQALFQCKLFTRGPTPMAKTTIRVYFPPDGIQLSETSATVREGESKNITCRTTSSSNPAVSVSVMKKLGSTEVDVAGSPSVTDGANSGKDVSVDIKIDTNRKDNGALYICTFTYDSTTTFRKTATVNVLSPCPKPGIGMCLVRFNCRDDSDCGAADELCCNSGCGGRICTKIPKCNPPCQPVIQKCILMSLRCLKPPCPKKPTCVPLDPTCRPACKAGATCRWMTGPPPHARCVQNSKPKCRPACQKGNVCEVSSKTKKLECVPLTPNTTLTYVKRHGTKMTARWVPLQHSFTKLQIKYCRHDDLGTCRYHVVTDQAAGETSFVIEGSAMVKSVLVLYLEVFDGPDLVFRSKPVTESREGNTPWVKDGVGGTNVGMIVGVTVTVILVIVAVFVTIFIGLLHRRNMACFSGSRKAESGPVLSRFVANPIYGNMNPAFEAGENAGTSPGENEAHDLHLDNTI